MYKYSIFIIILLVLFAPYSASTKPQESVGGFAPLDNFEELDFKIDPNLPKNA